MLCRLLPHATLDGPANMALDEALLDSVDSDPREAVLRTYDWSEPTLSLGYFQDADAARSDPRWAGVPLVRRPSGGGALWHDHELTYALVVPRSHPLAGRPSNLYRAVHAAIAGLFRDEGIPAERRGEEADGLRGPRPFLCFLDRDPEDILLRGRKIVGSAQRRRTSAVLQHGSLLIRASMRTPELPGLTELLGRESGALALALALREVLPAAIGLSGRADDLRDDERRVSAERVGSLFGHHDWTFHRRRTSLREKFPLP